MNSLVFFSGGSALARLAGEFAIRDESPVWIITTFDSGGSTQAIRRVFDMPAVGDLRNRLLASASPARVSPEIIAFLRRRVSPGLTGLAARAELLELANDPGWRRFPEADPVVADLESFFAVMPPQFDATRASIGNLAITGAWLAGNRRLGNAISRYEKILALRSRIIPVLEQSLHMGAELASGEIVIGQHLLGHLGKPITRIFLTSATPWGNEDACEVRPAASDSALAAIRNADLICFAIGSFYSSLLVNLLPEGIGRAIAESQACKVMIPNTGPDPETGELDIAGQIGRMLAILRKDAPEAPQERFLDFVLIDSGHGSYPGGQECLNCGFRILDLPVVGADGKHDPVRLRETLLDLACQK